MNIPEDNSNTGKKIGFGLLGGLGAALLAFIVITLCVGLAFPFFVTANGGSYAESQFFLNFVIPPICGSVAALVAAVVGFILVFRRVKE